MPRLPKNIPLSRVKEGKVGASMVFACVNCWSCDSWSFIAYNHKGRIGQVRRCMYWSCLSHTGKGKWITQKEQFERTKYQHQP